MNVLKSIGYIVVVGSAIGAAIYAGSSFGVFTNPCEEVLSYTIGTYDERFGISRAEFEDALIDASALWNTAAGYEVLSLTSNGKVPVHLLYGEKQQAVQLGTKIDSESSEYDAVKAKIDAAKDKFDAEKVRYERMSSAYDRRVEVYEAKVAYWNQQGGAPSGEYAALEREKRELDRDRNEVNAQVKVVNGLSDTINMYVKELNALAATINTKVDTYNEAVGEDFEQGQYISDATGARINIYEFTNGTELRRVLAHEFGHALGFEHVENPDSIMYSYNVGSSVALTPEDTAELKRVCEIE